MPAVLESQAFTSAQEPNRLIKYVMKVQDSPHVVEHLHAYRKCVIDKHEEPEECNLLGVKKLMVFAHVFGVHPFKGTTKHRTDDCCDKGTILSKFSIFGAVLTVINFLVVVNHAQLNVVQRYLPKIRSGIFSNDASESFLQLLIFLVAFLTLLIILFNLPSLHALLHAINSLQICNPRHQRVVLAWKIVSVSIFCIAYVFKVFGQIYGYLVLSNQSIHQLFPDWTDYNPVGKFFVFLDVIYYNLIEFPICQIPLLYLSIIALGIGLTFKENADKFKDATTMTQQSLHRFHTDLTKLSEILCLSEKCFNKLLFLTVFSSLVQIIFRTYLFCQAIRNPDSSFLFVLLNTSNLLISNVVWTFVFVLGSCVFVNETSRGGIFKITSELVDDELKPLKDQVYQKLTDYSWGFTVGKFVRIERPLILTMISLIFTIVVIWLQFSISNTSTPIAAPAVPLMPNH